MTLNYVMNEYKHICIYILLHEPQFSTVTPLTALTFRVSLHDRATLDSPVFGQAFIKLTKSYKPRIILAKIR